MRDQLRKQMLTKCFHAFLLQFDGEVVSFIFKYSKSDAKIENQIKHNRKIKLGAFFLLVYAARNMEHIVIRTNVAETR